MTELHGAAQVARQPPQRVAQRWQIGRVLEAAGEDVLVIYIQGDNGASAEGSLDGKLYEQSALAGVAEDPAWAEAHIDDIGTARAYNLIPGGWGWAYGGYCCGWPYGG